MKLRERDMKNFSENLNQVFNILNKLTDSEVFQSTLLDLNDGEGPLLHIKVCGRDSVWVLPDFTQSQTQGVSSIFFSSCVWDLPDSLRNQIIYICCEEVMNFFHLLNYTYPLP